MLSTSKVGGISFYMHINIKKRPKPSSKEERLAGRLTLSQWYRELSNSEYQTLF